nr:LacI family DNA-binding transcriptional regulator [Demequina sp.]
MDRPSRPTLRDVALRAGVSRTTASYALAGRATEMRISDETADRVLRAAAELGFSPNRTAQSLRTRRSHTIGLISDYVAYGEFAGRMLAGASAAARARGTLVLIGETEGDASLEQQLIEEMLVRGVDGLVYATLACRRITVPEALRGTPAVLLNCFDASASLPAVVPDEVEGGRRIARIVLDAQVDERTVIVGNAEDPTAIAGERRIAGIHAEFAQASRRVSGHIQSRWEVGAAFDEVSRALADGPLPTALICLNDRIAMGAYEALEAAGLRVPHDVSVVAFDGSNLAQWLRPSVTSVGIPFEQLGALAVDLLLGSADWPGHAITLPMPVIAGASVRAVGQPGDITPPPIEAG